MNVLKKIFFMKVNLNARNLVGMYILKTYNKSVDI